MGKPIYHLKNIRHFYGDKKVLDIPDLKIESGSITGIIGPNGSGKTTLLKLLAFISEPSRGQVIYKGRPEYPFSKNIRSKVTLLTQKPYLLKRSVFDNVSYGLKLRRDNTRVEQRVSRALALVGLDFDRFAGRMWHELSGGEAQRVALAARLILKPQVLLLDEPIASVDADSASLIRTAALSARTKLGTTLVIVSHDKQWLYSISDTQLSIYKGTMFATGMENVITGPFEKGDGDLIVKRLADGQRIALNRPADLEQTALLRKQHIALDIKQQESQPQLNQLTGNLTTMMLEGKTGFILATITCQDLTFVLRLTPDQVRDYALCPGKEVLLKFNASDIEWLG
jgi:tungstate transport system ATP-binding protein